MPVPNGIISTSTGPVDPTAPAEEVIDAEEAEDIAAFDAAIAELEEEELPVEETEVEDDSTTTVEE